MHNLSYPLNVEGDDQQGHYIMFMINETTSGKMGRRARRPPKLLSTGTPDDLSAAVSGAQHFDDQLNKGAGKATMDSAPAGSVTFAGWRAKTTRMAQAITLYMPPSVKVSYKTAYKDQEIGGLTGSIADATGGSKGEASTFASIGTGVVTFLTDMAKSALENAPGLGGSVAGASLATGMILGDKMELLFTGVDRRSFSFQFNFIPKSEQEARMVYDIVQTFKEHMLPEFQKELFGVAQRQGRILRIPDTFDIHYFYKNNENPFLNRISTCYLTTMDIDYGGEKYITYEPTELNGQVGPPPQRTSITLSFSEIETITRERAKQGF